MTTRPPAWETVPRGTQPATCRGRSCGATIYWIERPRKGKPGTARVPVDCDVEGGQPPDSMQDGRGVSHYTTCPNANEF